MGIYGYPLFNDNIAPGDGNYALWSSSPNLPNSKILAPGPGITLLITSGNITIVNTGSGGGGSVLSVSASNLNPLFQTSVSDPTINPIISYSLNNQLSTTVFAGPSAGASDQPSFRQLTGNDIFSALQAGTNVTLTNATSTVIINASGGGGGGSGSVTLFSANDITGLATQSVTNPTTTPQLTYTLTNQACSTALMGPVSGTSALS